MITNVHTRRLPVRACEARRALDQLASADDRVWPSAHWPAIELDRGLQPGSLGGHGTIRYTVESVAEHAITFRFVAPRGMRGVHRFEVVPDGLACQVRHTIEARPSLRIRIVWLLAIRPLHNALIEDLLDNLTAETGQRVKQPARWSPYVRVVRARLGLDLAGSRAGRRRESIRHEAESRLVTV